MGAREDLDALSLRLEEEEAAYARLLGALDGLASFPLPAEAQPEAPALLEKLNTLFEAAPRPSGVG